MQPSRRELLHTVDSFNSKNPVGTPVIYTSVKGDPTTAKTTKTRSEAWVLSGHSAVVMVEGVSGCVLVSHIAVQK